LIQTEIYLLYCYRYIELNPVRAKMVDSPGDYGWSSYGANAYGELNTIIKAHPEYLMLGKLSEDRLVAYRELFRNLLDNRLLHKIRTALNEELVVGSSVFKEKIEKTLKRRAKKGQAGRPKKDKKNDCVARLY